MGGGVSPQSESAESRGLTGEGTAGNPYQIATANDLREFAQRVNNGQIRADANAILTDDINLNPGFTFKEDGSYSGPAGVDPQEWTPIGTSSINQYRGTFNGDGHTISGLYIDSRADYQGLFGFVGSEGTVQNLSVSGSVSVSGGMYVGGIAGQNNGNVINCAFSGSVSGSDHVGGVVGYNNSSVENCYNTGTVTGPDSVIGSYVGGVVGYNNSNVENCYNTGTVTGSDSSLGGVGGVVGYNNGGTVENCYNTGDISGGVSGGVVGWNDGTVENCYNTSSVKGDWYVGGVVGYNNDSVKNCYNTGKVTGTRIDDYVGGVGGVVGYNISGTVENCYFLQQGELQGIGDGGGGATPLSAEAFESQKSFAKWDFGSTDIPGIWKINTTLGRPVLKDNHEDDGSEDHPYEIFTATQLAAFRNLVNGANGNPAAWAVLMENITLKSSEEWEPIGNSESTAYTGTFDGQNFKISGLYIKNTSSATDYQGLFGRVSGTVQNLTVSGNVSGRMYVGGVVGLNGGTVENCYNTSSVKGDWYVGGVVGYNNGGTVKNCYNTGTGTVTGTVDYVGGVVGYNSGPVKNCYNTGTVTGPDSGSDSYVGGVVGHNYIGGSVTGCYFLQTADVNKDLPGIGFGGEGQEAIQKTADAFHSGEVAYLLEQNVENSEKPVWGQSNLNTPDSWPTLIALDKANAQKVYQVTFNYGTSFADNDGRYAYSYTNGVVSEPTKNPELAGHTLSGWYSDESLTTEWNFDTEIFNDTTLYAKWTAVEEPEPDPEPTPEPEPEEPPYSGKYSYELTTSVGDHGSLTVDRYATEGDKVTIEVAPDQAYKLDDLSVTANGKDVELTANSDGTYTFTMPSADVKISATFAEDPDWTEPEEPATDVSDIFSDIAPDAWYKDAVQYAYDNGLMTGVSATEFAPEQTTTRAMIVSILARLEGVTTAEAAGFADVNDNDWYATAVNWAANVGVVNGYEDNTFQPNTAITREQLAAILMNYAAYKGEDVSNRADLTSYTDQPSTWATETMSWAVAEGLISGVTNDQLQPQGNATRAQVAAILQRFLEA